jgi:pantoate--beta-alanine ligase
LSVTLFAKVNSHPTLQKPTRTYFGQKDIQQALLLRRLCADLHLTHPSAASLHIVPTARDPSSGLALSSRNVYLSPAEMRHAPTLYVALQEAKRAWGAGATKGECLDAAAKVVQNERMALGSEQGISIALDYLEMNDPESLQALAVDVNQDRTSSRTVLLSGAMWVGKTRLVDNIILGDIDSILG